jgi:hypothetical protein
MNSEEGRNGDTSKNSLGNRARKRYFNKGKVMYAKYMLAKNSKVFQELPKTALCRENDRFQDRLQKLPNNRFMGLELFQQPMHRMTVLVFERSTLLGKPKRT